MNKKTLDKYKKHLISEKEKLAQELEEMEKTNANESQSAISGDNAYSDSFADSASLTFEREKDYSLERNIKDLINKVDDAIQRIEKGEYGNCEVCGRSIEEGRLEVLPYASLCLTCKKREERGW